MDASWPRWFQRVVQQNEDLTGLPAVRGNEATLIGDYQGVDRRDGRRDRHRDAASCTWSSSSSAWDDTTRGFFAAMERAVARGVTVRLLADHIAVARRSPARKETFAELDRIGVKWAWMLPVQPFKGKYQRPDLRNHRKILVVDGRVAFMGSQNLIARSYDSEKNIKRGLQWQELVARLDRPGRRRRQRGLPVRLAHRDRASDLDRARARRRRSLTRRLARRAASARSCRAGPGYRTENNLRLFLVAHLRRDREGHPHEPLLRARRGDALRHHDRVPAGSRSAAVRLRDRRPVPRLPRAALLLRARCSRPACGSSSTRRRTSCTPSTSRSTTTSP